MKKKLEWWEKEEAYENTWLSGKASHNLWRYIPDKVSSGVADVSTDSDGYWIYLNPGWISCDGDRIIHAYLISDLKEDIKTIRRVALDGDNAPGKWICRKWSENKEKGWLSTFKVFDTEEQAEEHGLEYVNRDPDEDEFSRHYEVYKG